MVELKMLQSVKETSNRIYLKVSIAGSRITGYNLGRTVGK